MPWNWSYSTVRSILLEEGWPLLVVRVFNRPEIVGGIVEKYMGKTVRLCDLLERLNAVSAQEEVRVAGSFSPSEWWLESSWGYYRWPWRTLRKEGLCDLTVEVLPASRAGALASADLAAYLGLGLVSETKELKNGNLYEYTEPIAALVIVPRKPRPMVSLYEEYTPDGVKLRAVTAHPQAVSILERHGFKRLADAIYEKLYPNEQEMLRELDALHRELKQATPWVYLLKTLDRKLKTYREIQRMKQAWSR